MPLTVRNVVALATIWSAADALDMCVFAVAPTRALSLHAMTDLLEGVTGWVSSDWELMRFGERRLHLMQLFNRREGLGPDLDTLPAREFPYLVGLYGEGNQLTADERSDRCRKALLQLGGSNPVRALEQRFERVRYFACSALGRAPDPRNTRPFRALGIAEPLLWLLGVERGTDTGINSGCADGQRSAQR